MVEARTAHPLKNVAVPIRLNTETWVQAKTSFPTLTMHLPMFAEAQKSNVISFDIQTFH